MDDRAATAVGTAEMQLTFAKEETDARRRKEARERKPVLWS